MITNYNSLVRDDDSRVGKVRQRSSESPPERSTKARTWHLLSLLLMFMLGPVAWAINPPGEGATAFTTCGNATVISPASLPIVNQNTVCGTSNDISASNVIVACGSNDYKGGLEALYVLTPTISGSYNIAYSGQTWTGIFVFQGCPTVAGTTCVNSTTSTGSSKNLDVTLTAGVQYYIMFDTWPSPASPCAGTFSITPPPVPCEGTPIAGTVTPTSQMRCNGAAADGITVSGFGNTTGLTYLWQQSTDGGSNWDAAVGGAGATTATYTPPNYAGTAILYRAVVTCAASGVSTPSASSAVVSQTAPTTAASAVTFSPTLANSATISWTSGSGGRRYVVVNTANSFTNPVGTADVVVAGTAYTSGERIVYDGTGTSVTVTGLVPGTTYYARVFEYNRCTGTPNVNYYNVNTATNNPSSLAYVNNDDCANAITLNSCSGAPQTLTATTVGSTADPYIDCGATGDLASQRGIWYRYIGDNSNVTINTCNATGYDTRLTVYSGSCGSFTCVAGNDDMSPACPAASFRSEVNFNAMAGTTYYVYVHGYQSGTTLSATGTFVLNWTCAPLCTPIAGNDECSAATALTIGTGLASNNTCSSGTVGVAYPSCGPNQFATYYDTWYSFNSGAHATLEVSATAVAPAIIGYSVYSGVCGTLTEIACQATGTASSVSLAANTVYYVRVWSANALERGSFTVRVKVPCLPPTAVTASNITPSTADLTWTPPVTAPGSGYEYALNTSATPPAAGTPTSATSYAASDLVSGTLYYFHVRSVCGAGDVSPWVTRPFRYLIGDNCALAIDLTGQTSPISGTTAGASDDYDPTCNTSSVVVGPDMFYKLTVPAGFTLVIGLTASSYDSVHSVYYGNCSTNTSIVCTDSEIVNHTWVNETGSTQTVYWVQDAWSSGTGTYTLAWTLTPPPIVLTSFAPTSACSSDVENVNIILTGSNFLNATDVKLNGVSMPFTVNSDTQITVDLDSSATTGTIQVVNAVTSVTTTASFTVNANPTVEPIAAPGGATNICLPDTMTLTNVTPTGIWSSSNVDVATVNLSGVVTSVSEGSADILYTVTDALTGCATVQTYPLTISTEVQVTSSTPTQAIREGEDTSFSVTATGTGVPALTYMWEVCTDGSGTNFEPVVDGTHYAGSNTATLQIIDAPLDFHLYFYQCTVTGVCNFVISDLAVLLVGETGFNTQPQSVTVCESGTNDVQFTVEASEDVTLYQWYEDQGGDDWQPISNGGMYSGANSATLTLTGVTTANSTWRYKVLITGIASVESNPATLTVAQSVSVTGNPSDASVCYSGGSATFGVTATGGVSGYSWQHSSNGGASWTTVANGIPAGVTYSGAATANLTVNATGAIPAAGNYLYRAVVSGIAPCAPTESASAQLLINNPTVTSQPAATTVFAGNTATFTVAANTMQTASYQWQYATAVGGPYTDVVNDTPAGVTYSNANTATLSVVTTSAAVASTARYYRAVVSSGAGCNVNSNGAQLTINNYCIPPAITGTASYFNSFTTTGGLTNINNSTGFSTGGYGNYVNLSASQFQGESISYNTGLTGTTVGVAIFVDWNSDGDFTDTGEAVAYTTTYTSTFAGSFTVPAGATPGPKRMRIYMDWSRSDLRNFPCGPFAGSRGEMEDYTFNVLLKPACTGAPAAGTISTATSNLCVSGTATLTASGYQTGVTGITFQWYNSQGPIASATGTSYTTPVLTAPETYFMRVICSGGAFSDTNSITIGVSNPSVAETTAGSRCGVGTVSLGANVSAGATPVWYTAASGGTRVGSGSSFTTPSISSTTNFYVAAEVPSVGIATVGTATTLTGATEQPTAFCNRWSSYQGQYLFTAAELNAAGLRAGNITAISFNISTMGDAATNANYKVAIGTTTATAMTTTFATGLTTVYGPATYTHAIGINMVNLTTPYNWDGVSNLIIEVTHSGANATNNSQTYFTATTDNTVAYATSGTTTGTLSNKRLNIGFSGQTACSSARTAVAATVVTPPVLTLSAASATICAGTPATVQVTAGLSSYDTFIWTPNTGVTGSAATGYIFNPAQNTSYTLTASQSGGDLCATSVPFAVVVNSVPAVPVIGSNSPVCEGGTINLTTTAVSSTTYTMNPNSGVAFIDIASTGTAITGLGDDTEHNITIPSFTYNGVAYTTARVAMNGIIALGSTTGDVSVSNVALPTTTVGTGNIFLAPYWDDLDINMGATIKTQTVGSKFIIQYTNADHNLYTTGNITFQVQLDLNNGQIHFVYNDVIFGSATYDAGVTASIGIQLNSTTALGYSNNTASLTNGQAITFSPPNPISYAWSGPNGFTSTVQNPTIPNATSANAGVYTLVVSNVGTGCSSSASQTIVVNPNITYYADADNDGYGNPAVSLVNCTGVAPAGYVANNTDCNDAVAAINPGAPDIPYNGVDDDCDGTIDETGTVFTTLLPTYCGTTLASIHSIVGIYTIAGHPITGYRIRATNGSEVQTIETTAPHFVMTQFASYAYATTYTIEIQLQRAGLWQASWGAPCFVSTPAILAEGGAGSVNPLQCGITLSQINTLIATSSIQGVTGYRFRVSDLTNPTGPNAVQTIERTQNWFSLPMLARYNYGTLYRIEVSVKTTGTYGGYGAPCELSSPPVPSLVNCGGTVPSKTSTVAASSVPGATQYRFQVVRASDNASATIDRGVNWFNFNMVPSASYTAGALYFVRVAVMTAGTWSPFGDACEFTAPGGVAKGATASEATATAAFKAAAYPNPFTADFSIEVTTPSQEKVQFKVYDMLGKLVESREADVSDLNMEKVGAQYPAGVYNVIVSQGGIVKTLRVIKR